MPLVIRFADSLKRGVRDVFGAPNIAIYRSGLLLQNRQLADQDRCDCGDGEISCFQPVSIPFERFGFDLLVEDRDWISLSPH